VREERGSSGDWLREEGGRLLSSDNGTPPTPPSTPRCELSLAPSHPATLRHSARTGLRLHALQRLFIQIPLFHQHLQRVRALQQPPWAPATHAPLSPLSSTVLNTQLKWHRLVAGWFEGRVPLSRLHPRASLTVGFACGGEQEQFELLCARVLELVRVILVSVVLTNQLQILLIPQQRLRPRPRASERERERSCVATASGIPNTGGTPSSCVSSPYP
jgi:hypothetical protein